MGFGNDPRLGAVTLRAPVASREDSRPQAILKFQPRNSFDYRVRYEPQLHGYLFRESLNDVDLISAHSKLRLILLISQYRK